MPENTSSPAGADDDLILFLNYLEAAGRRKKMITAVTVAAFLLSIGIALLLPKVYSSTARILPPQQDQGLGALMMGQLGGGLSSLAGSMLGSGTVADQYASILESERVKDVMIDRFNLMQEYQKEYRLDMYRKLEGIVEVKAGKKDGIISITVEDEDPRRCADIANAYVEELGRIAADLSMSSASDNRKFLDRRLSQAKADLARAEDAMKAFQTKNNAVNVADQAKATLEGVAMLRAQIASQESQLSGMRSQYTDSAQEVQVVKASIGNLRAQLARLEGKGTGSIPSFGSVPSLGQEQVRLLREYKTQEMLVELLTKQVELAKLTEAKDVSTVQVIQKATVPDKKVKPKRALIVIGTTFLAFSCAVGWALLGYYRERMSAEEAALWKRMKHALSWRAAHE